MTIREVKEMYKGEYVEVDVNDCDPRRISFHTDSIHGIEDYNEDWEVIGYALMDEEEYGASVAANWGIETDFEDWYGDKNAQVLVILVSSWEDDRLPSEESEEEEEEE